jgi:RimJ/RimL family protein N-acetyltransferase
VPAISLPEPPLSDGDIMLRPWVPGDAPAVTTACQDPEIPRWTVVPHHYTERHARDFIAQCEQDLAAGRELALAVVDAGDRLIGAIGISDFDWADRKAEVGYWVARPARRRGVGRRALGLLSRWALVELGLERIELLANPENEASLRLAERAGFTREGTLRLYRRRHGVREDLVMFSILAADVEP